MNRKIYFIIIIAFQLVFFSCSKQAESPIPLSSVQKVIVNMEGTLYLYQDTFQFASVAGPESAILKMNTTVENGVWEVYHGSCKKCKDNVEVVLVVPNIEQVELISSGNIIAEQSIVQNDISIINKGTGMIEFRDLKVDSLYTVLQSEGGIKLSGEGARVIQVSSRGTGDILMNQFAGINVFANVEKSGNIHTTVIDNLEAVISGSGNVLYKGSPVITQNITGSGKVINNN